jgi:hypothetical protein
MKCRVALHLLHDLMNVPVQHRERTESLKERKGLFTVRCAPAPVWIDCPERNMREEHDRGAVLVLAQILLQPIELSLTESSHALQLNYIHQADEMYPSVIEAVPPVSGGTFAVSLKVKLSVVDRSVMLARNIKYLPPGTCQHLIHRVEFGGLGRVCQIAGVKSGNPAYWGLKVSYPLLSEEYL